MRVYIACNLSRRDLALEVRGALLASGHHVVSTWHDAPCDIDAEAGMTGAELRRVREQCLSEIDACDVLVLVAARGERHGAHVEAGYAMGSGRAVVVYPCGGVVSILMAGCLSAVGTAELRDVLATMEAAP